MILKQCNKLNFGKNVDKADLSEIRTNMESQPKELGFRNPFLQEPVMAVCGVFLGVREQDGVVRLFYDSAGRAEFPEP